MKTFLVFLVFLISAYAGEWQHYNLKADQASIRVSFTKSYSPPTYGMPYGAVNAHNIYLDVWGVEAHSPIEYTFRSLYKGKVQKEFKGFLESTGRYHSYVNIIKGYESVRLRANEDYEHELRVDINGRTFNYQLDL